MVIRALVMGICMLAGWLLCSLRKREAFFPPSPRQLFIVDLKRLPSHEWLLTTSRVGIDPYFGPLSSCMQRLQHALRAGERHVVCIDTGPVDPLEPTEGDADASTDESPGRTGASEPGAPGAEV